MSKKVSSVTIQVTQGEAGSSTRTLKSGEEVKGAQASDIDAEVPPVSSTASKDSAKSCPKCGHLWKAASSEPWPPCDDARHTQTARQKAAQEWCDKYSSPGDFEEFGQHEAFSAGWNAREALKTRPGEKKDG